MCLYNVLLLAIFLFRIKDKGIREKGSHNSFNVLKEQKKQLFKVVLISEKINLISRIIFTCLIIVLLLCFTNLYMRGALIFFGHLLERSEDCVIVRNSCLLVLGRLISAVNVSRVVISSGTNQGYEAGFLFCISQWDQCS